VGGDREGFVPQTKAKTNSSGQAGQIRFHEKSGEVHFHDDAAKLKVAVPVAEWSRQWNDLQQQPPGKAVYRYFDSEHSTLLNVEIVFNLKTKTPNVDLNISIDKIDYSKSFADLQKFTNGG
jgi:hypothetical protein